MQLCNGLLRFSNSQLQTARITAMPQLSTKLMQAAVYDPNAKGLLYLSQVTKPELKNNNAIVQVTGCGVCGSDLLKLDRALVKQGTVLGHEMVGVIHEISSEMSQRYNLRVGDRIVSSHHVPCGACNYCLNKQESLCKTFKSSNFNPGAFCEYTELSEEHLAHTGLKIPAGMTDEVASFTEPVACCIKAIKRSKLNEHQGKARVLVIGLGSIGLILGQLASLSGAEVTGMDMLEARLELARELGFNQATKQSITQHYNYIFLAAGSAASINTAIEAAADGATIVVFSRTKQEAKFDNNDIYYRELTITSSYSPNLEDLRESLQLLEQNRIQVSQLITHRSSLEKLGSTIEQAKQEQGIKVFLALTR